MPFPDEPSTNRVQVVPYQPQWAAEGAELVLQLERLVPNAVAVDHIGSTSVPGMAGKDCLDAMIRVQSLETADLSPLVAAGYRERSEAWNRYELLGSSTYIKRVFASPLGGRSANIHIREMGSGTARYALLFRDFLRADSAIRDVWGGFKSRVADADLDIYDYGQVKGAAQPLLMALAERWAAETSWQP